VTVVAKEYASPVASGKRITSEIAGALWEWPPAVCGRHTDEKSLERSKVWCMDSYGKFMELAMNPKETGAYLRQSVFYFKDKVSKCRFNKTHFNSNQLCFICYCIIYRLFCISFANNTTETLITSLSSLSPSQVNDLPTQLEKMEELCHLPGFRHDAKLIEETGKFAI